MRCKATDFGRGLEDEGGSGSAITTLPAHYASKVMTPNLYVEHNLDVLA